MGAIQGAKNQALFREPANERRRDLGEAFKQAMGETTSYRLPPTGEFGLLRAVLDQPTGLLGTIVILTPFGVLAWAAFGFGFYRLVA